MTISWAHPWALALLILVPLYPLLVRRTRRAFPYPRASLTAAGGAAALLARLPEMLRTLLLVLLVLAIAAPSTTGAPIEEAREGIPIALAVDVSSSMLAQDFQPADRLSVAKDAIADFVRRREADPISIVAFAAEAVTLVPVTMNRPVLNGAVESLQVGLLEDGTAIGDGLATAVNRLRHLEGADAVVVLLSDGESNRGTIAPLDAADAAAALGVRVHTIGVGSESVAQVPVGGGPAGFRYAELPVGLDEELLAEIARRTGGAYFRATDATALQQVYARIDELVPRTLEVEQFAETSHWAGLALMLAAALLVAEWGLRASRYGAFP